MDAQRTIRISLLLGVALWLVAGTGEAFAAVGGLEEVPPAISEPAGEPDPDPPPEERLEPVTTGAEAVAVSPRARDEEIAERLRGIFAALPGIDGTITVEVEQGVVVLRGVTADEEQRRLLGEIARRTQDVVAVLNRVGLAEPPLVDVPAALAEARRMGRTAVRFLPRLLLALIGLVVTIWATRFVARASSRRLRGRLRSPMLVQLAGNALAVPVLLLGLYIVLRTAELTSLALTVLGGTGLFGLVLGIAFRDIAENYLASVLISTRRPFRLGDTIEVAGVLGIVRMVTTRGTLLVTFDGNHVLIPNAIVYKSTVTNTTANPKLRQSFLVGIGADESVAAAQDVVMKVLEGHEAVLAEPPPMVLVEQLGSSTVDLRVYYWVDGHRHAVIKVASAVMRLVRRALLEAGISMPPEVRELDVPRPVSVRLLEPGLTPAAGGPELEPAPPLESPSAAPAASHSTSTSTPMPPTPAPPSAAEPGASVTDAEAGLSSEQPELEEQARRSHFPDQGRELLGEED